MTDERAGQLVTDADARRMMMSSTSIRPPPSLSLFLSLSLPPLSLFNACSSDICLSTDRIIVLFSRCGLVDPSSQEDLNGRYM